MARMARSDLRVYFDFDLDTFVAKSEEASAIVCTRLLGGGSDGTCRDLQFEAPAPEARPEIERELLRSGFRLERGDYCAEGFGPVDKGDANAPR